MHSAPRVSALYCIRIILGMIYVICVTPECHLCVFFVVIWDLYKLPLARSEFVYVFKVHQSRTQGRFILILTCFMLCLIDNMYYLNHAYLVCIQYKAQGPRVHSAPRVSALYRIHTVLGMIYVYCVTAECHLCVFLVVICGLYKLFR